MRYIEHKMQVLSNIEQKLYEMAEQESLELFRLARKAEKHGCSPELIAEIREEAFMLHNCNNLASLIDDFYYWKYAFKLEGISKEEKRHSEFCKGLEKEVF